MLLLSTAPKFVKKMHGSLKYYPSYIFIVSSFCLTLHCNKCFLLLNWTKLDIFVSKCSVSLFHLHLKRYKKNSSWRKSIRPSSSAFSILYFVQGNFTNWKHNIAIFSRYLKVIRKINSPYSCNTSNVSMFRYRVISITFWDFKSLQGVLKTWKVLKAKNKKLFKRCLNIEIPFIMISNPDFSLLKSRNTVLKIFISPSTGRYYAPPPLPPPY